MSRYVSDEAGQFVSLPHAFWNLGWSERLSSSAIVVYLYLKFRAGSSNDAYPSLATIATSCGMSKSTVVRTISELETAGLISVTRVKSSAKESEVNHYSVLNLTQGVVQNSDHPSYKFDTTPSTKIGLELDTIEQDTSEQDTSIAAVPKSDTPPNAHYELYALICEVNGSDPKDNPKPEKQLRVCSRLVTNYGYDLACDCARDMSRDEFWRRVGFDAFNVENNIDKFIMKGGAYDSNGHSTDGVPVTAVNIAPRRDPKGEFCAWPQLD
jgi:hypothetical protein